MSRYDHDQLLTGEPLDQAPLLATNPPFVIELQHLLETVAGVLVIYQTPAVILQQECRREIGLHEIHPESPAAEAWFSGYVAIVKPAVGPAAKGFWRVDIYAKVDGAHLLNNHRLSSAWLRQHIQAANDSSAQRSTKEADE